MRAGSLSTTLALALLLAGCGGGSAGTPMPSPTPTPTPAPTPTPTPVSCSLSSRQAWALAQLQEWYLFPDLLDTTVDPKQYSTLQDYVDALVAPARAQSKDRYFTYVTSIAEENAYFGSGQTAGYGMRLVFDPTEIRLYASEAYENAPALAAGIDRGTEILAIGTSAANLKSIKTLYNHGGVATISDALGPQTAGTTRVMQIRQPDSTVQTVTVIQADFTLDPVSSRYGAQVIDDNGRKVGYVNLRTFVDTADPALRSAFATFRAQGVTDVIVDLRYNGGGLIAIAELFSDLLNAQRAGQVQSYTTFRASKSSENATTKFTSQPEAVAATRVAFIGTESTASASELVMNAQRPYLPTGAALVGANTYGKPVGQIGRDLTACDDRLRLVALKTENASHQGDYYTGLASEYPATCAADDDIDHPFGDPREASVSAALAFLDGRSCTPIGGASAFARTAAAPASPRAMLEAKRPNAAQRDQPGLF